MWRHLHTQFGGGPTILRWGEPAQTGPGCVLHDEYTLNLVNKVELGEATVYVSGKMPFSKVKAVAAAALSVKSEAVDVWETGDNLESKATAGEHGIANVGTMVRCHCSHRGPSQLLSPTLGEQRRYHRAP